MHRHARRWRVLLVALAAGIASLAVAVPAQAAEVRHSCTGGGGDRLSARAVYIIGADGWYTWTMFEGRPYRPANGDDNNVNFYFHQDGVQHWTHFSPDNVRNGATYTTTANVHMPPWSHQRVTWEAVFDRTISGDPRCQAFYAQSATA